MPYVLAINVGIFSQFSIPACMELFNMFTDYPKAIAELGIRGDKKAKFNSKLQLSTLPFFKFLLQHTDLLLWKMYFSFSYPFYKCLLLGYNSILTLTLYLLFTDKKMRMPKTRFLRIDFLEISFVSLNSNRIQIKKRIPARLMTHQCFSLTSFFLHNAEPRDSFHLIRYQT